MQKGYRPLRKIVVTERRFGVAGHIEHLQPGPRCHQRLHQSGPVHLGHDHIGQHQIETPIRFTGDPEGGDAICRLQHGVAQAFEDAAEHGSHHFAVFNQQDRLGAVPQVLAVDGVAAGREFFLDQRQIDPE